MIVLALVCALVIALLGGALVLYGTEAMWHMDSPNARAWNATLNATATWGISVIPLIVLVIGAAFICLSVACSRGF